MFNICQWPPVLGISGFSNSGKTTLIEQLLPILCKENLKILVMKKHGHNVPLEEEYKDTSRFYQQGADSWLHDEHQILYHRHESQNFYNVLNFIPKYYDLVLMEGNRHAKIPKLWLSEEVPEDPYIISVLPNNSQRLFQAQNLITTWLNHQWHSLPLAIGIYGKIGDSSDNIQAWQHTLKLAQEISSTYFILGMHKHISDSISTLPLLSSFAIESNYYLQNNSFLEKPSSQLFFLENLLPILTAFHLLPKHRWLFLPPGCEKSSQEIQQYLFPKPGTWIVDISYSSLYKNDNFVYGLYYPNFYHFYKNEDIFSSSWHNKIKNSNIGKCFFKQE